MATETEAEPEAPQINISVSADPPGAENLSEAEAQEIATAAETVVEAAEAAVALAEVQAARTIADFEAELAELREWQATAKPLLEECFQRLNSMPVWIGLTLEQLKAEITATAIVAAEALEEATEAQEPPPNSPEEEIRTEALQESVEENPAPEPAPAKAARKRTFV